MIDLSRSRRFARIGLAIALALLGLWIVRSFLPALIWAAIIAIAVGPLYARAEARWPGHRRVLLPIAFTLAAALLVLVPIALGVLQAAHDARNAAQWISAARVNGVPVPAWVADVPFGGADLTRWWQANLATPEGASLQFRRFDGPMLIANTRVVGTSLLHRAVIFVFTLFALFFLLRDGKAIEAQLLAAGERMFGPSGERIGHQIVRSVRGTIDGLVLVGIGEGLVMTLAYVAAGVPHAVLLGVLTAIGAMIPFGAALLFGIAALLLLAQGSVGWAIAIVVLGLVVVGIADHAIRPILIGGATRLPFLWVLLGILGGVESFGLLGLFIGPATMAVLIMLWREFIAPPVAPPPLEAGA